MSDILPETSSTGGLGALQAEKEILALQRLLQMASGFKLVFAVCDARKQRKLLAKQLWSRLQELNIQSVELPKPLENLLEYLRDGASKQPDAVFVDGLEASLFSKKCAYTFLANLNAFRDSFPSVVPCPLVLWVSEADLLAISRDAPDFFSIRSGAFRLNNSGATGNVTILHLSDLHFGSAHRYPDWELDSYNSLFSKLTEDLDALREQHDVSPDAVVVTGDLTCQGKPSEFEAAGHFLNGLREKLEIERQHVVIVPGNSDLNPRLFQAARLNAEANEEEFTEPYFHKFDSYRKFIESFYEGAVGFHEGKLFHTFSFESQQVLVAGLNSCVKVTDEVQHGWIGLPQVKAAIQECDRLDPRRRWLRIGAMHHNFVAQSRQDHENLHDADEIEPSLLDGHFALILHGHQLVAGGRRRGGFTDDDPELLILGTGSAGLDTKSMPDHPNQYQIIRISGNEARLFMRQYSGRTIGLSGTGAWVADTSRDSSGIISLSLNRALSETGPGGSAAEKRTAMESYLDYLRQSHRYLPLQGTGSRVQAPIELEPIYVTLRAMSHRTKDGMGRGEFSHEPQEILPLLRMCEAEGCDGMVVLGNPGSGKTTLMKYLAWGLAGQPDPQKFPANRIPLFLPLRALDDFQGSVADALRRYYARAMLGLPADFFEDLLNTGGCLLLFDGLDEVADRQKRLQAIQWIQAENGRNRNNTILVTSRYAGYRGEHRFDGDWMVLNIQDFRPEDRNQFIRNWYLQVETQQREDSQEARDRGSDLASHLIAELDDHPDLVKLARNPLMLSIICVVNRTGTLPRQKTELYEKCMDVLLEEWDRSKGMEVVLTATDARQVLRKLALWLHEEDERTHAGRDEVKAVIRPRLAEVRPDMKSEDIENYVERTLLNVRDRGTVVVGHDIDQFGFQHLSFQEFLAADEIVKESLQHLLVENFGRSWWKDTCLLAVGMDDPRFQKDFYEDLFRSNEFEEQLAFALDCVRATRAPRFKLFYEALAEPEVSEIARSQCIMMLREIAGPENREELLEAIKNIPAALREDSLHILAITLRQIGAGQDYIERVLKSIGQRAFAFPSTVHPPIYSKDGTLLITIPAGEFTMGSNDHNSEKPQRTVYLDTYRIAHHPVTNAQYRMFIEETGHREPGFWEDDRFNQPNQPVVDVTWPDAQAYCKWAGLRLPTEAEWEKAARGEDSREYPWGPEQPDETRCNFDSNVDRPTEVGSYPEGASPYGCQDMAGNVWEWCQDWYGDYNESDTRNPAGPDDGSDRIVRGGSYFNDSNGVRGAYRSNFEPSNRYYYLGFRCAQ